MKYIQKGDLDDKIVSQLLQIHQTFFVTYDFLYHAYSFSYPYGLPHRAIVFGKYINLLSALISKWLLNRLVSFHEVKKNLFINASSISIIFLLHMICCEVIGLTFNQGCWTTQGYSLVNRSTFKYSHFNQFWTIFYYQVKIQCMSNLTFMVLENKTHESNTDGIFIT